MLTENSSGLDAHGKKIQNVATAVLDTDVPNKGQMDTAIQTAITTDISDNNIAFTGTNTHSGTETFSNGNGVTTNVVTERTAGAGTSIKTPVLAVTGATLTSATTPAITALTSGTTYTLSKVDGITVTLPACSATNVGLTYKFVIITSVTSVGYIINTTGSDVFVGGILGRIADLQADPSADSFFGASTANKTITLSATTTCGLIGGHVIVTCVSATQWHVSGLTLGTGDIATPFSN